MHRFLYLFGLACWLTGCSSQEEQPGPQAFTVQTYEPVPVSKSTGTKVYVHLMPWFETKASQGGSTWGIHWTMATKNPDIITGNGQQQIASHYYPLTGPYASGDPAVIEYQALLMKLAGIDGVLIDWPGTTNLYDYPLLVANTERIMKVLAKVGLQYAIVYEDQNINIAYDQGAIANKIAAAQNDMAYAEANYFADKDYIRRNGKPLLMVFGPQTFAREEEWTQVFAGLDTKPDFFTLWSASAKAGANAAGEFAWVNSDHLTSLNSFYNNAYSGSKIAAAYPGFKTFYAEGGWGGPTFSIDANGSATFKETLDLALSAGAGIVQLVTWNDYGEGTMIEPTKEFGYSLLTTLQETLGVVCTENDLKAAAQLYMLRNSKKDSDLATKKLDQVFYYLISLQTDRARSLLDEIE